MVVKIEPDSRAWRSGLREGDIILSLNRMHIRSIEDVGKAAELNPSGLLLNIQRGESVLFLIIR